VVEIFVSVVEYVVQMLEQLAAACSTGCARPEAARAKRRWLMRCMMERCLRIRVKSKLLSVDGLYEAGAIHFIIPWTF